ncbi:MAG: hypothetical protein RL345_417 [Chloroflexota bacterium]|jgi:hypothetical protein|nr:hypothetical protein [Chloroflexota bacterium]
MFRNLLIIVAVFGLGWGGSFAAGMTYGQRQASLASPAGAGGQSGARAIGASTPQPGGGGQSGGLGAQGGPGGRMTVGTVARVDGLMVFLTTGENQEVAIAVSDQTPITRPEPVALADLATGTRVTVMAQGAPGATAVPGAPLVAQSISVIASGTGLAGAGGRGQVGSPSGPSAPANLAGAPTSVPAITPPAAPAMVPTNVSSQRPTVEARVATPQSGVSDAQPTPTDLGQGQRGPRADAPRQGGPPGGGPGQGARAPAGQGQGGPEGRQSGGPNGQNGGPGQSGPEGRAPGGQGGPGGRGPAAPPNAP